MNIQFNLISFRYFTITTAAVYDLSLLLKKKKKTVQSYDIVSIFNSEGGIDTIWTAYILATKVVKPADWPREDYRMIMTGVFVGKFYPNSKGDQSGRGSGFICPLKEPYSNTV